MPSGLTSGIGSGARPPIWTTSMRVFSSAALRATRDRVALEVLAVGDEHDDAHVLLRLRIAREQLARALERARDGGAADGHVVRLELPEELRDRGRSRS